MQILHHCWPWRGMHSTERPLLTTVPRQLSEPLIYVAIWKDSR